MVLIILRCLLVLVAAGLAVSMIRSGLIPEDNEWMAIGVLTGMLLLSAGVIALDICIRRKELQTITAVYFGMIVGFFLAYVVGIALIPLPMSAAVRDSVQLTLGVVFCYACISLLLQTKDDFRFIIPYVEFAKEIKRLKPCVLDTSVVIDGRIADVVETNVIDGQLVMPKFVIAELQAIADSSERLRRSRGRRGLDVLNRLRNSPNVELEIYDRDLPEFAGQPVDMKLVVLARHLGGKLLTNDYNLNKVARLHGVSVINLNDLANSLKPVFLPGERIEVQIVKPGEESGQGIGYLDDGTMVVVEGGRDYLGKRVALTVTSVLQTSAGRMVFGRFDSPAES